MKYSWVVILCFCVFACKPDFDKQAYLEEKLQAKILTYLQKERLKCKTKARDDAETHIDSLINQWISEDLLDTIKFPSKPAKPGKPGHIIDQWVDPKIKQEIAPDSLEIKEDQ